MKKISIKQKITLILFGMFLSAVLLEVGLRIGGFVFLSFQEYKNGISIKQKGTYRILCLGDSTTANGGVDSYPSQLEHILNQRDIGIKFSVINRGVPGMYSGGIVAELENNLNKYNPDIVITLMGINDLGNVVPYRGIFAEKIVQFLKSFRTYKLVNLLWSRSINKTGKTEIYKSEEEKQNITVGENDITQLHAFKKREKMLKKTIEADSRNGQAYIELGWCYGSQRRYDKAAEMFKKAIEVDPENGYGYIELGWCYADMGEYDKAKEIFKKAIKADPENAWVYIEFGGWWFIPEGKHHESVEMLKNAIEADPEDAYSSIGLGWYYIGKENLDKATEMFKKAIEVGSEYAWSYIELGFWFKIQKKYDKATEMFKKAIEVDPGNAWSYIELGWCYKSQDQNDKAIEMFRKAAEMFKKAIEINPRKDALYGGLAICYKEQGESWLASKYFRKAKRLRLENYNPITRHNYQRLKEIVTQRRITLVCVQYPLRSVEPLKRMFKTEEGIIFVDNERVFKKALRQGSYSEYFVDTFFGDSGHCTTKGNKLLAENIADVILKERFNK